jgi:hypothetical protein
MRFFQFDLQFPHSEPAEGLISGVQGVLQRQQIGLATKGRSSVSIVDIIVPFAALGSEDNKRSCLLEVPKRSWRGRLNLRYTVPQVEICFLGSDIPIQM